MWGGHRISRYVRSDWLLVEVDSRPK
jgi:hypothetical protein